MSKALKRIISLVLVATIISISCINAFAMDAYIDVSFPVVVISGDGNPIVDKDGNDCFNTRKIGNMVDNICNEGEEIVDAVLRIFVNFLKNYYIGCITGNFENYYNYLYEALKPIMGDALLNCDGEVTNGSSISKGSKDEVEYSRHKNYENYNTWQYVFKYDWRLDPLQTADELNAYIKDVKAATGHDKIGIICRCLGANVFLAYVSKYGMDDIRGVGFNGVVTNGSELLSEPIGGKFKFDANAINRLLIDLDSVGMMKIDSKITSAIDTATKSGLVGLIKFIVKFPNYNRIVKGITSAISLSTFYTWPNYWGAVKAEDYQTALEYVFGPVGSEKRQQYAKLIEKLDAYDVQVRQRIPELMKQINDSANLCIISKYGMQCAPIARTNYLVGDQFISVKTASFGATTSSIFEPLSDEYIAKAVADGKEKYISPDKQIDASTCMFPDQTFFYKGASHSDWTRPEMELLCQVVCADRQLTVDDLPDKQFMVFSYETMDAQTMNEENCHSEYWTISESERTKNPFVKISDFFKSAKKLIDLLKNA